MWDSLAEWWWTHFFLFILLTVLDPNIFNELFKHLNNSSIFSFMNCAFGVKSKNSLLIPRYPKDFLLFFLKGLYYVLHLSLWLVYLKPLLFSKVRIKGYKFLSQHFFKAVPHIFWHAIFSFSFSPMYFFLLRFLLSIHHWEVYC